MEIVHYIKEDGKDLYQNWIDGLKDTRAKVAILRRIDRLAQDNLGDCKVLREGIFELRIDTGPGYRVYFFKYGLMVIVLLSGGDKRTQNADINRAIQYKVDFLNRLKEEKHE